LARLPSSLDAASRGVTRRDVARAGVGLALSAGVPLAPLEHQAPKPTLRKGLSFGGPQSLRADGHPHDYRLWGNRDLVTSSGTTWIKLWVSWDDLLPDHAPADRAACWAELNVAPGGAGWLARLDAQVRAANDDGVGVILALYQAHPAWATGAEGPEPGTGQPALRRLPLDLSPDGPFGWWLEYLCARYGGALNPTGPRLPGLGGAPLDHDPTRGNPLAARVDLLQVANEANYLYWPQTGIAERTAEIVTTAEKVSSRTAGPGLLAPGTLDLEDPGGARAERMTDWRRFTDDLLDALSDLRPRMYLGWAVNNYGDVKQRRAREDSVAAATLELLRAKGWPGDQRLWIVESGVNLGSRAGSPAAGLEQARAIAHNFREMSELPGVHLWTQHGIHDLPRDSFRAGLRREFLLDPPRPGRARPALGTYRRLRAARTPW